VKDKFIVGIDEVGRGPIAGPVAVCAFMIKNISFTTTPTDKKLPKLKDSKKLTKHQRVTWYNYLKGQKEEGNCDYSVSFVSPKNFSISSSIFTGLYSLTSSNLCISSISSTTWNAAVPKNPS
jgi:ribonuclease HII